MATVWRPSSDAARNTRIAISLRLATRMRRIGAGRSAVMMESCSPQHPTIGLTACPDEVDPPFGINRIPGLDPGIGPRVQLLRMKIDGRAKPGNDVG